VVEGDSITYLRIGQLLMLGRLDEYDGAAPPAYGAFLQLFGGAPGPVQAAQSLLGTGIAVLTAWLVWRPTRHAGWAIAAGLAFGLALDTLCFEAYLVTETFATAALVLSVALLTLALERPRPSALLTSSLSLALSLAGLTKPFLLFLFPLAALALAWRWRAAATLATRATLAFVLPVALLVGSWCWHNGVTQGVWGPSTMTGYRLTQHVGSVMEDAPDRYRVVRDIFLAHRARLVAETGSPVNTIWRAIPDMQRATGLSYGRLSLEVNAMSVAVAKRHPMVLAKSIAIAWVRFWSRPMYLKPSYAHSPAALRTLVTLAQIERPLALGLNALLLGLVAAGLVSARVRRRVPWTAWTFAVLIMVGSVLQAFAEHSDNGRFAVPFLPLVGATLAIAATGLRRGAEPPGAPAARQVAGVSRDPA